NTSLVALALSLAWARQPSAQDRPIAVTELAAVRYIDPVNGMSIDQAVATGLEHEPELQAIRSRVDAASGLRRQAAVRPNPTISAMRQEQLGGSDATTSAEVQWPLDLFRRSGRLAVAD